MLHKSAVLLPWPGEALDMV